VFGESTSGGAARSMAPYSTESAHPPARRSQALRSAQCGVRNPIPQLHLSPRLPVCAATTRQTSPKPAHTDKMCNQEVNLAHGVAWLHVCWPQAASIMSLEEVALVVAEGQATRRWRAPRTARTDTRSHKTYIMPGLCRSYAETARGGRTGT